MMNSSDDNDQITNLKSIAVNVYKYLGPVVYILGNLGNLLSALIFTRKSWKKNVCVFYFKICLFIDLVYVNSHILVMALASGYEISLYNTNVVLCKSYGYISYLFGALSPVILILASIDRLLISSQDVDTRLYSSKRLAYFSISICTAITSIYHIHYLIKAGIHKSSSSHFECSLEPSKSYLMFASYSIAAINLLACLFMIILCIIAFKNVRRIRTVPRQKRTQQIRSMTRKDLQLLRCLYAKDIIYTIFSMMITIYYVYSTTVQDPTRPALDQAIEKFTQKILSFLFLIPYTSSFFVFMVISKAFRHELQRIIYKMIGKEVITIREEENRPNNAELDVVVASVIKLPT